MKIKNSFKKVGHWCKDHAFEITLVSGSAIWFVVGCMKGHDVGYLKGLSEFRKFHIDTAKAIMDNSASEGAFLALNLVRSDGDNYKKLIEDPDVLLKAVQKLFYESDYFKDVTEALES